MELANRLSCLREVYPIDGTKILALGSGRSQLQGLKRPSKVEEAYMVV